ncbi:MAG: RNA polymerase sigma factor RpoD/SigA, partial [Victivallales bacterium]|nr:RNA polymerase sigma factor RpoD/SigA [Victivallales bacterium]
MLSDNDTMKLYMQNIGQYELITPQQEVTLAALIKKGDEDAKNKLISGNLRLVVKIAHDFKGLGLPLLDLISEGNIGLMRAVEKFDPSKGAKLSSYAAWWIKQSMRRALANQARTIRIPVQSASKISKIQAAKSKLAEQLGREPTNKEIAEEVNLTERTVQGLQIGRATTISLHDPIQNGEDGEYRDIIPDEKSTAPDELVQDEETLSHMMKLIEGLEERERTILELRFGLQGGHPKTLEEVSQTIGRTRERVRQIQNQALDKLKAMLEEDGLLENYPELANLANEQPSEAEEEEEFDEDDTSLEAEARKFEQFAKLPPREREQAEAKERQRISELNALTLQKAAQLEREKAAAKALSTDAPPARKLSAAPSLSPEKEALENGNIEPTS